MDSSLSQSPCSGPQTSAKVSEKDPNLENYPSADPLGSGTSLFSPKKCSATLTCAQELLQIVQDMPRHRISSFGAQTLRFEGLE